MVKSKHKVKYITGKKSETTSTGVLLFFILIACITAFIACIPSDIERVLLEEIGIYLKIVLSTVKK